MDVFLSQFIFKTAGAWGQPWHQDSFYFPFEPARPVVGVWLAVTEATLANGCLHVLPGSQTEPVHTHEPDRRPGANYGYFEIVDHDMSVIRAGADGTGRPPGLRQPSDAPVDRQRIPRDPGRDGVPLRRRRDDRPHRGVLPVGQRLGDRRGAADGCSEQRRSVRDAALRRHARGTAPAAGARARTARRRCRPRRGSW